MKTILLMVSLSTLCTGCTSLALERHTLRQVATLTDMRFQQVMNNLAATANNSAVLPAYAPIGEGTALVQDTVTFDPKALWTLATFKGFASDTISITGQRQPQPQWTLDPASEPLQLKAMRFAFIWALCGAAPPAGSEAEQVLQYFQVYDSLTQMPTGWLQYGECITTQHKPTYRATCGRTAIWVNKDGMEGLSALTLIIQDISTVSLDSLRQLPPTATVKIQYPVPPAMKADNSSPSVQATASSVSVGKSALRPMIGIELPDEFGIMKSVFAIQKDFTPKDMTGANAETYPIQGIELYKGSVNPRQNLGKQR